MGACALRLWSPLSQEGGDFVLRQRLFVQRRRKQGAARALADNMAKAIADALYAAP